MEWNFAVDIPNNIIDDPEWVNVGFFKTKEEAIKFAQENFGADEEGKISLISNL